MFKNLLKTHVIGQSQSCDKTKSSHVIITFLNIHSQVCVAGDVVYVDNCVIRY